MQSTPLVFALPLFLFIYSILLNINTFVITCSSFLITWWAHLSLIVFIHLTMSAALNRLYNPELCLHRQTQSISITPCILLKIFLSNSPNIYSCLLVKYQLSYPLRVAGRMNALDNWHRCAVFMGRFNRIWDLK